MWRIVFLVTVAALVLVSTPFVVSAVGAHKQPKAVASQQPKAVASQQPTRTVEIQGFRFRRANITIKRGTRVRWINRDSAAHTATANNVRSFDSGRLRQGQRYSHTFKMAGKKGYHCKIHPHMRASVVVKR
jgi:plastocyanin